MWAAEKATKVPRTKTFYRITSCKGQIFFVKPGKAWTCESESWKPVKSLSSLSNRIDRVTMSPYGSVSVHVPKMTPMLAVHQNSNDGIVFTIPLPQADQDNSLISRDVVDPSGTPLLMTRPFQSASDLPAVVGCKKSTRRFGELVQGVACSETGNAVAIAIDNRLWLWQQYPEEVRTVGFWTDLTANQRFTNRSKANYPETVENRVAHGFRRVQQRFTITPALAPNIPENSAVTYQDLCIFENPDEGVGTVCLTAVFPPSKPFDMLHIAVSVCTFRGFTPVFERANLRLPIANGDGAACSWWSIDCRFVVIAASRSIIVATRHLRLIAVKPLSKVFVCCHEDEMVASVAWSCSGRFFVITSTRGAISALTRCGKDLTHDLCHLKPLSSKEEPVLVAPDAKDPELFVLYTDRQMRTLRIPTHYVPDNLQILISLHFPQKTAGGFYPLVIDSIHRHGVGDPLKLVTLLYFTEIFRIWPYSSPLRHMLLQLFESGTKQLLDGKNDVIAMFVIRNIYKLTGKAVEVYDIIMERLSWSNGKKERILRMFLDDELQKADHSVHCPTPNPVIDMYDLEQTYSEETEQLIPLPDGRDVELLPLVRVVKGLLWDQDFDPATLDAIPDDLSLLLGFLINTEMFDKALDVSKHQSISMTASTLFLRIAAMLGDKPGKLYEAMTLCIAADTEDEEDVIRATCVKALVNTLRQKISDSMPTAKDPELRMISTLLILEEGEMRLIVPESEEQFDDVAVIFSLAFAASGYVHCAAFCNARYATIPAVLREPLRSLFSMLWFLKWRYLAVRESAKSGQVNDATLRLLAFPEFVNCKAVSSQINDGNRDTLLPDVLSHYTTGSKRFELDPAFAHFAGACLRAIKPRVLAQVSYAAVQLAENNRESVPKSGLVLAFMISHMVPWLRAGIPRAFLNIKCGEKVPSELLVFEDFHLPTSAPLRLESEPKRAMVTVTGPAPVRPSSPVKPPERGAVDSGNSDTYSSVDDKRQRRRKPVDKKRSKSKKPRPRLNKPNLNAGEFKPPLRQLDISPVSANPVDMQFPPNACQPFCHPWYGQWPYYPDNMYYPDQQQPQQATAQFAPVWDFDPSNFQVPGIVTGHVQLATQEFDTRPELLYDPEMTSNPPPRCQLSVAYTQATEPEPEPQTPIPRPMVVVKKRTESGHRHNHNHGDSLNLSMSSDMSELDLPVHPRHDPPCNPFPLDDGLDKRLDKLLAAGRAAPVPDKLHARPQWRASPEPREATHHPEHYADPMSATPQPEMHAQQAVHPRAPSSIHHQSSQYVHTTTTTAFTANQGGGSAWRPPVSSAGGSAWRPPVHSAGRANVVRDGDHGYVPPQTEIQLHEI